MTPAEIRKWVGSDVPQCGCAMCQTHVELAQALADVYELLLSHKQKHLDESWHTNCRYCESEALARVEALTP